jgi:hypothetical protein
LDRDYCVHSCSLAIDFADLADTTIRLQSHSSLQASFYSVQASIRAVNILGSRRHTSTRDWHLRPKLRQPNFFLERLRVFKMRVQSLFRVQSLATSSLRCSARSAAATPSRCALSTIAATRTPYTNGTKTDTWICSQTTQPQRRWQSVAAQVYVPRHWLYDGEKAIEG